MTNSSVTKLTDNEMILFFKNKNISLGLYSEKELIFFLKNNTYFFKLISYRKTFPYENNKYSNLSVDALIDMSTIDMQLRYIFLKICLDLEHSLKTQLINEITFNTDDNGYTFLNNFIDSTNNPRSTRRKLLKMVKRTDEALYEKYQENLPIWVALECSEFAWTESIIRFYIASHPTSALAKLRVRRPDGQQDITLLTYVRNIRNKSAHNSIILNRITTAVEESAEIPNASNITKTFVSKAHVSNNSSRKKLRIPVILDMTTTLAIYDNMVSSHEMKKRRYTELKQLMLRIKKNKQYYKKNNSLTSIYNYFNQLVNYLNLHS
ncbi:Abi family protein [Fructobacillus ficulneus]|uniref:Abi family protein n=1 Tax=Fructobacillus ficulneus TaxID=157463 RepID=A0A0K8MHC1_9LACO|nr:Abi family protein [Fructobacillus ficulneus]GAO99289.1 hypothetical protein FFIC_091160 [Fructobacillus ficulneus]